MNSKMQRLFTMLLTMLLLLNVKPVFASTQELTADGSSYISTVNGNVALTTKNVNFTDTTYTLEVVLRTSNPINTASGTFGMISVDQCVFGPWSSSPAGVGLAVGSNKIKAGIHMPSNATIWCEYAGDFTDWTRVTLV